MSLKGPIRNTQYAIRNTQCASKARYAIRIRNTQYAVCLKGLIRNTHTQYAIRSVPQRGRCTIRNTQYAIRNHAHSRLRASHPIRNTQYAIRNHAHSRPSSVAPHTQYAIRNTQYATCLTEPCCQYAKPSLNTQSLNTLRIPYVTPLVQIGKWGRKAEGRSVYRRLLHTG